MTLLAPFALLLAMEIRAQEGAPATPAPAPAPTPVAAPAPTATPPAAMAPAAVLPKPGAPTELRDPFSPLGYNVPEPTPSNTVSEAVTNPPPRNPDPGPPPADKPGTWPKLVIKATMKVGPRYVAKIEDIDKLVEAGETVEMRKGGYLFRWKIESISEKGLQFKKLESRPIPVKK